MALEHTDVSQPHWEVQYPFPCCLIVGYEVEGIQVPLLQEADLCIEIPMFGAKHPLNASVAFGIAVYKMVKQVQHSLPEK